MDELRIKLARAGYRSRDTLFTFLLLKLVLPIVFACVAFFFVFVLHAFNLKPILGLLAVIFMAMFGLALPNILVKNQSQKRGDILRKAMPDALDLLVICAEAGLSLDSSLDRVSREIGPSCPELAEEVGLTGVELGFFPDRAKALQNLADRVPQPGVMALTNTLIQTEKYGTPLAQALRVLSAEMREERMMAAEAKAAKLPATLTIPMILFILPPLFVVLIGPAALKVMGLGH
jgi:tight adherence protein C